MPRLLHPPFPSPQVLKSVVAHLVSSLFRRVGRGLPDGANVAAHLILRRAFSPAQVAIAITYPLLTIGLVSIAPPLSPQPLLYCVGWWSVVVLASIWPILDHFFDELRRLNSSGALRDLIMGGAGGRELGDALTVVAFLSIVLPLLLMLVVAPFLTRLVVQAVMGVGDPLPPVFFGLQFLAIPLALATLLLSGTVAWWQVLRSNSRDARSWLSALVATVSLATTCMIMPLPFTMLVTHLLSSASDWSTQVIIAVSVNAIPSALAMLVASMIVARLALRNWPSAAVSGQFEPGD